MQPVLVGEGERAVGHLGLRVVTDTGQQGRCRRVRERETSAGSEPVKRRSNVSPGSRTGLWNSRGVPTIPQPSSACGRAGLEFIAWLMRMVLPAGSRKAQSRGPHGWSIGSCSTSAPEARTCSKGASRSSVRKTTAGQRALVSERAASASPSACERPACGVGEHDLEAGLAGAAERHPAVTAGATSLRTSRPRASR